jgi:acyl-coenzyme A thioesterase PaaI-like protein
MDADTDTTTDPMPSAVAPALDHDTEDLSQPVPPALTSPPKTPSFSSGTPVVSPVPLPTRRKPQTNLEQSRADRWYDKAEAFVSRLSVRDNFWRAVCSLIWLPLGFFSGLTIKQLDADTFAAILPFRRFNRNWYRAMAGGALLANSEIAGGAYVFGICGGDYTVVCKTLSYTFMRPCYGPAVYRMRSRENIHELLATGGEFNITLDLEVRQQASRIGEKDKRVGKCEATFHVTPKVQHKIKAQRGSRQT